MKTLKNILFAAISIACILLGIYSFRLKNDLDKINRKDLTTKKAIEAEAEIISRKIDKEGLQHATIAAAGTIVSQSDIKGPAVSVGILDTTAMAIGVLKKQIENLMVVNSTLRADNLRAYQALDEKKKSSL